MTKAPKLTTKRIWKTLEVRCGCRKVLFRKTQRNKNKTIITASRILDCFHRRRCAKKPSSKRKLDFLVGWNRSDGKCGVLEVVRNKSNCEQKKKKTTMTGNGGPL